MDPKPADARFSRRKVLVDHRLQGKLVLFALGCAVFSATLTLADFYRYFGRSVSSNLLDPSLLTVFLSMHKPLLVQMVFFLALVGLLALLLSHRLAGPLFSLKRSIRAVVEGDFSSRASFRRSDELRDVKEDFNRMMDALQSRASVDKTLLAEADGRLEKLLGRGDLPKEARAELEQARAALARAANSTRS